MVSNLTLVFKNFKPKYPNWAYTNLTLGLKIFEPHSPNMQIWAFWVKNYQLSNFNEILSVSYIEGADFKSHICFRKFELKSPDCIYSSILNRMCVILYVALIYVSCV